MATSTARALVAGAVLLAASGGARALDDQWYLGLGGGAALLRPDAVEAGLDADEKPVAAGTLFAGRDLDDRTSVQLQLHGLGETEFEDGRAVTYTGGDASVLYRFFDSRDRAPRGTVLGVSLYGRFGLGYLQRDTDVALEGDADVNFGAGAGLELYLTRNVALRAEGLFHDRDAGSAGVSIVTRFGGRDRALPPPESAPPTAPGAAPDTPSAPLSAPAGAGSTGREAPIDLPTLPSSTGVPAPDASGAPTGAAPPASTPSPSPAPSARGDTDGDGIVDATDTCPSSSPGYPVRDNGCALLDGVLSGLTFIDGTAELAPGAERQLDYLANLLEEYPTARVELLAHTDDAGTVRDQSILTRARLRTIGTDLVARGIRANRLVLRSFGGTRPLYDNRSAEGRAGNNRIEIIENAS